MHPSLWMLPFNIAGPRPILRKPMMLETVWCPGYGGRKRDIYCCCHYMLPRFFDATVLKPGYLDVYLLFVSPDWFATNQNRAFRNQSGMGWVMCCTAMFVITAYNTIICYNSVWWLIAITACMIGSLPTEHSLNLLAFVSFL